MRLAITLKAGIDNPVLPKGVYLAGWVGNAPACRTIVVETDERPRRSKDGLPTLTAMRRALTLFKTDPQVESWQTYTKVEEAV